MAGIRREKILVSVLWRGERMVLCGPRFPLVIEFEHREVDDPQRLPALLGKTAIVSDLGAQRAHGVVDDLFAVRAEEDQVAVLSLRARQDLAQRRFAQELDDRRLQSFFVGLVTSFTLMYARPPAP